MAPGPERCGRPVVGRRVPCWPAVLDMARRVAGAVGLGYLGVDIVLDAGAGPMLLEANARPGLAIQIANGQGLLPRLAAIDAMLQVEPPDRVQEPAEEEPVIISLHGGCRKSA